MSTNNTHGVPTGFWDGAPKGERRKWIEPFSSGRECYYVITSAGVTHFRWTSPTARWLRSLEDADHIRSKTSPVDDLHPLVPGQQAIDWADKLLRDPEVAGWTEAWTSLDPEAVTVDVARHGDAYSYTCRHGAWVGTSVEDFDSSDEPYRTANTAKDKEETVTTKFETHHCAHGKKKLICGYSEKTGREWAGYACPAGSLPECKIEMIALDGSKALDEFKARVYKVGKAAAVEHGWCGVFDELMDELGIEKPKIEWPKPGTLFKSKRDDFVALSLDEHRFLVILRDGQPRTHEMERGRRFTFADSFESLDQLEVIPV